MNFQAGRIDCCQSSQAAKIAVHPITLSSKCQKLDAHLRNVPGAQLLSEGSSNLTCMSPVCPQGMKEEVRLEVLEEDDTLAADVLQKVSQLTGFQGERAR